MIIRDTASHPKITSDHRPCQGLAAANYRVLCVLDSGFDQRRPGRVHQLGADASRWCTLAAGRGESTAALDLYRQALAAFEAVGDRGEVARILSEMAWACLDSGELDGGGRHVLSDFPTDPLELGGDFLRPHQGGFNMGQDILRPDMRHELGLLQETGGLVPRPAEKQ